MNAPRGTLRYWINLILFTLVASIIGYFAFAYLGVSYFMARGFTHPQRAPLYGYTPENWGYFYEDVALTTQDGLVIRGWYIPSKNQAVVILLHSMASNRLGTIYHAVMFADQGYGVLMIDIRAHGESDGELLPFGGNEILDVIAAVDYLQTRSDVDADRIGVMGFSLGSSVGVLSTAQDERIAAVAADGQGAIVFEDWPKAKTFNDALYVPFDLMFFYYLHVLDGVEDPLSYSEAVSMISPRPIFFIGGESEERAVSQFYNLAGEPKKMWLVPDGGHIDGLEVQPELYEEKVIEFFDYYLLGE